MATERRTRWDELTGGTSGADYAARFAALAASGTDVHGEATFCAALVTPPAHILDAGCGTGRVAIRLAELGYRVTGSDADDSMLAEARRQRPDLTWLRHDLAEPAPTSGAFALAVAAGNVIPLLAPGTVPVAVAGLAGQLAADGLLVTGFGLDRAHLPRGCPVTPLADFDRACEQAGLRLRERYRGWDGAPYLDERGGYAVSVHVHAG